MGGQAELLNKMCMAAGDCQLGTLVNQMITLESDIRARLTNVASILTVYGTRINDLKTGLSAVSSVLAAVTSPGILGTGGANLATLVTSTIQPVGAAVALTLVTSTLYGMASDVSTI